MRHGLSSDIEVPYSEPITGPDDNSALQTLQFLARGRSRGQEDGQVVSSRQRHHTPAVIAMFVGH
jgi:hypothetical protein